MNVSVEMGLLVAAVLIFCSILISKTGYRFGVSGPTGWASSSTTLPGRKA